MDRHSISEELTLLQVIKTGSFSDTAHRLGISQSSVSRRISSLETRLGGVTLLSRSTRRVIPTKHGAAYADKIQKAFDLLHEADQSVVSEQGDKEEPAGELRISLPPGMLRSRFASTLGRLSQSYEKLNFEIMVGPRYWDLYKDDLDMTVRLRPIELNDTHSTIIGHSGRVFVASPLYLNRFSESGMSKKMEDHIFIVSSFRSDGKIDKLTEKISHEITKYRKHFRVDDTTLQFQLACEGHGIAFLDWITVERSVTDKTLELVNFDMTLPTYPVHAIYRRSLHNSAMLNVTIDALAQTIDSAGMPY